MICNIIKEIIRNPAVLDHFDTSIGVFPQSPCQKVIIHRNCSDSFHTFNGIPAFFLPQSKHISGSIGHVAVTFCMSALTYEEIFLCACLHNHLQTSHSALSKDPHWLERKFHLFWMKMFTINRHFFWTFIVFFSMITVFPSCHPCHLPAEANHRSLWFGEDLASAHYEHLTKVEFFLREKPGPAGQPREKSGGPS